jgi:ribosome biogenesis GTPase A
MSLHWYPGHMNRARRELEKLMPSQDVVIEVLDARLPASSANPLVTELRRTKPCIKVLTKSDLADPTVTQAWLDHFHREPGVLAFAATTTRPQETRKRVAELSRGMAAHRGPEQGVRAVIVGVPNVGKSTLVNTLVNKKVAAVGDKPAVTKEQQRVVLESGMVLTDSPGITWTKFADEAGAHRLAFAGSLPDTAIEYVNIALFGGAFLLAHYPALVLSRYKLDTLPATPEALLEAIGKKRGKLKPGGVIDVEKAAEILVHEFRDGTIGRISLERPPARA